MKKIMLTLAVLGFAGQAMAYDAEVGGELRTADFNDVLSIFGSYYLDGVKDTSGPLREAAFLDQANEVRAGFDDYDGGSALTFGGRYIDKASGFFGDGELSVGDIDGFRLEGGLYLSSASTVSFFYDDKDDFFESFGAEYKQVVFQNDGTYMNLEAGVEQIDQFNADATLVSVGGDYYLDKNTSVGAGVSVAFGDADGFGFEVQGTKFVDQNLSFNLGLSFTDYDNSDSDIGLILGARYRISKM